MSEVSRKQKKKQREKEKKLQKQQEQQEPGGATDLRGAPDGSPASAPPPALAPPSDDGIDERRIEYLDYEDERQLPEIMAMVDKDLSEPYSVFTYRYFLHNWPGLCLRAVCDGELVGVVICKAERELDRNEEEAYRGYIAMLAVSSTVRRRGIGSALVLQAVRRMVDMGCDEAMLETEVTNRDSLRLYGRLGFVREERLVKYYLNGVDAFRLKLWFDPATLALCEARQSDKAAAAAGTANDGEDE